MSTLRAGSDPSCDRSTRSLAPVALTALAALALAAGCATRRPAADGAPTPPSIDELLASGVRVLWVAAHPDDEAMAGPLLASACVAHANPCHFMVLTRGGGGECGLEEGCDDLAAIRAREMAVTASLYGAELEQFDYFNASLPIESFPTRDETARRWIAAGDPARHIAETIRRFRPDVVITFDPTHGFTCHPEHQLAARFAHRAIERARDDDEDLAGLAPHAVSHLYYVLNHYALLKLFMGNDPSDSTEGFDVDQACSPEESCLDMANRFSHAHRTQVSDMGTLRTATRLVGDMSLRHVDPASPAPDPLEPAPAWCD